MKKESGKTFDPSLLFNPIVLSGGYDVGGKTHESDSGIGESTGNEDDEGFGDD